MGLFHLLKQSQGLFMTRPPKNGRFENFSAFLNLLPKLYLVWSMLGAGPRVSEVVTASLGAKSTPLLAQAKASKGKLLKAPLFQAAWSTVFRPASASPSWDCPTRGLRAWDTHGSEYHHWLSCFWNPKSNLPSQDALGQGIKQWGPLTGSYNQIQIREQAMSQPPRNFCDSVINPFKVE